jgi:hypothetical protein
LESTAETVTACWKPGMKTRWSASSSTLRTMPGSRTCVLSVKNDRGPNGVSTRTW